MRKKATLADIERIARDHDPKLWDILTPDQRQEMVDKLNAEIESDTFIRGRNREP